MRLQTRTQAGFSLIELLVVVAVFTIVCGAVFLLLDTAQQRYRMESEFLDTFQGARLAMDQMTRDIHTAGYPPANSYAVAPPANLVATTPFAWSPGYPAAPCNVPCATSPTAFDMLIESDVDPNTPGVEWIRYRLNGTTLERGVAAKTVAGDPAAATLAAMVPYVDNVMNQASAAQMTQIRQSYPNMFPGNAQVPVFTYTFETGQPGQPRFILDVEITLIVMSPNLDPKTRQPRVVTLTGLARKINPDQ